MSIDDELFDQVGRLLRSRPGWNYEPSTTPGGAPSWCFDPEGEMAISVSANSGAVSIYLPDLDQEIPVDGLDALAAWIDNNEARFIRP